MNFLTILFSGLLAIHAVSAQTFTLTWAAPTNYTPQGYVIFHGTQSGAYSDCWSAGHGANYTFNGSLPDGANYFVVTAWTADAGELMMSTWSNETVVTNTPALMLNTLILTSTNLGAGTWLPFQTNRMVIYPTQPAQFFTSAVSSLTRTNLITFPPTP